MNSFSNESVVQNIIQTLSDLPDFLRKPIIESRLKEFFLLNNQDKREVISGILEAVPLFEDREISGLAKTWLTVLSNLDSVRIVEILALYCQEIRTTPEIIQRIPVEGIVAAFCLLEYTRRQKVADCLKEAILSFPDANKIVDLLPVSGLKALELR